MSNVDIEKLEQYLEPLVRSLLLLGQKRMVEKYLDAIAIVKENPAYKHHLFFWSYARSVDQAVFEKCFEYLEALREQAHNCDYDIEKCERFYEWRKTHLLVVK